VLVAEEVKGILYSIIDEIGKEKIQAEVTSNIESTQKYIDIITRKFTRYIGIEPKQYDDVIILTFCEALLHFMLTICTLPSERKITVSDDLVVDIVIPNFQILKTRPDKSIIVQIIKENVELDRIPKLECLQPNRGNIWLISGKPLRSANYRTYSVFPPPEELWKYSNVIIDVNKFLKEIGDKSFRIVH
jgi:hypothetical protein